ncbi:membrane-spanning 4-domains subfamily A member 12-like [Bombina bombina]|uniref:membrane-spanning 4-domains subfamily A member 12-like n=1 Tax=Bombina bombina TaxID=8345 RepID=UPI00235AB5BB|nr:membrane-spanning 4-domains subfamily A member 12-like [Bombina bombina]
MFPVGYIIIGVHSGNGIWGAVFYIISGSLSVAVEYKCSISMVKGALSMNIISCLASIAELGLICFDLADLCYYGCRSDHPIIPAYAFLMIASLVQFSLSVTVSTFTSRALKRKASKPQQQVFVMQNDYRSQGMPSNIPSSYPPASVYERERHPQQSQGPNDWTSTTNFTGNSTVAQPNYRMENSSTSFRYPAYEKPSY